MSTPLTPSVSLRERMMLIVSVSVVELTGVPFVLCAK